MLVHRPSTVREWVLRALGFRTERWAVVALRLGIPQILRVAHRLLVRLKWAARRLRRPVPADVVVPTHEAPFNILEFSPPPTCSIFSCTLDECRQDAQVVNLKSVIVRRRAGVRP